MLSISYKNWHYLVSQSPSLFTVHGKLRTSARWWKKSTAFSSTLTFWNLHSLSRNLSRQTQAEDCHRLHIRTIPDDSTRVWCKHVQETQASKSNTSRANPPREDHYNHVNSDQLVFARSTPGSKRRQQLRSDSVVQGEENKPRFSNRPLIFRRRIKYNAVPLD